MNNNHDSNSNDNNDITIGDMKIYKRKLPFEIENIRDISAKSPLPW